MHLSTPSGLAIPSSVGALTQLAIVLMNIRSNCLYLAEKGTEGVERQSQAEAALVYPSQWDNNSLFFPIFPQCLVIILLLPFIF